MAEVCSVLLAGGSGAARGRLAHCCSRLCGPSRAPPPAACGAAPPHVRCCTLAVDAGTVPPDPEE
ncbi:hypothetical protein E2C01_046239 [Portunus trituberculatus]|uniref:Uncharacterized protein n=1 Tax=Portunus trituberculatus TaxID=210409 RepID=A0A5B7G0F4_PORTR|nr:hypothetical protein [Portunus trituberculatus]